MKLVKIVDVEDMAASIFRDTNAFETSAEIILGHGTFYSIATSFER